MRSVPDSKVANENKTTFMWASKPVPIPSKTPYCHITVTHCTSTDSQAAFTMIPVPALLPVPVIHIRVKLVQS